MVASLALKEGIKVIGAQLETKEVIGQAIGETGRWAAPAKKERKKKATSKKTKVVESRQ